LSKFSDRLSSLGHSAPAKMGFGRQTAREKNPVMLLIGRGDGDAEAVDLVLHGPGETAASGDWGLELDGAGAPNIEAAAENGCQFLLVISEDVSADVLLTEQLAIGMPVVDGLPDSRIRAIEDGPFEFLLYAPEKIEWPLTVGATLKLQELVSSYSKHIFLQLPAGAAMPGDSDLEVLKNLPISSIVVDLAETSADALAALKASIGKLEPRKPSHRHERTPLVPLSGRSAAEDGGGGADYDDDDDDDWDD